jgi:hypothetical protein
MSDDRLPTNDDLSTWIVQHPEVWSSAVEEPSATDLDEAVRRITSGEHAASRANDFARRRRRAIAGGALTIAVLAGGTAGVAAVIRAAQPTRPNEGISCRAAADLQADAILIDAQADPVAACARLWSDGEFSTPGTEPTIPELTACITTTGVVEVVPGDDSVCGRLGLTASESTLDTESAAVLALSDRLTNDINLAECAPAVEVADAAQQIVDESGLQGWTVTMRADSTQAACAKTTLDAPTRTITVIKFP